MITQLNNICGYGGTGRRASFRCWLGQLSAGSIPVIRTIFLGAYEISPVSTFSLSCTYRFVIPIVCKGYISQEFNFAIVYELISPPCDTNTITRKDGSQRRNYVSS